MKLRHDVVLVIWDDAAQLNLGWMEEVDIEVRQMLVCTLGYLVKKTRQHILVASTVGEHAHCHAQFQIPRKMIQDIKVIARRGAEFPAIVEQL